LEKKKIVINFFLGDTWCDPFKTWKSIYNYKPSSSGIGKRVLGAEATLWSEMIWPQNFEWRVWPRASAMALRLWNEDEEVIKFIGKNKNLR
jgi:hexosaminidase